MKTLFVTHHYLNGFGGGCFASRSFISAFADLSEEMTLLYPARDRETASDLNPKICAVPVSDDVSRLRKMRLVFAGRLHRYAEVFPRVLEEGDFDTVVFDSCYPSFGMIGIAHGKGCRVITIHHNYQFEYVRDNYRFPLRGFMQYWTRRCEGEAFRRSDLNLTLTQADANSLANAYAKGTLPRTKVLGVFEQPGNLGGKEFPSTEEDVFIITGDLGIRQTRVSLGEWFADYYPLLKKAFPSGRLILAGKNPHSDIVHLCKGKDVTLVDTPPSMDPVLRQGRYYICPVSKGGGIKLRVMDGLRYGMPVISHSVSARGYERFEGGALFAYSDPASFVRALEDLKRANVRPESVRELYRGYFSYEAGVARLRDLLG